MKALTLYQPYVSAVALQLKRFETRGFTTAYRGPLAIHAAMNLPPKAHDFAMAEVALGRIPKCLPMGAVVCIVDLVDIRPAVEVALDVEALERLYGDYQPGRWAWQLDNVRVLIEPYFIAGKQGLWNWSMEESDLTFAATGGICER